jgi:hypothetical protein
VLARLRTRITYANVVSSLALFVLLGGSAYAAATIGAEDIKDSAVHSNHIADGQVKNPDVASDSVGGGKVIDGSLPAEDFRAGELRGPQGPAGPGEITFDRSDGESGGSAYVTSVNGVTLRYSCQAGGVLYYLDDEIPFDSAGGSGLGVVGTKQLNLGNPTAVHTGGNFVGFSAVDTIDLDVMAENNKTGKWTEFKLYSIHHASQHSCNFGGNIIP